MHQWGNLYVQFLTVALRRLSDPPAPGEVMRLRGAVLSIPGNSVHASDVITLSPNELVFTADNYTRGGATGRTLLRASYVGEWSGPSTVCKPKSVRLWRRHWQDPAMRQLHCCAGGRLMQRNCCPIVHPALSCLTLGKRVIHWRNMPNI